MTIRPPSSESPSPTTTLTEPDAPLVALFVLKAIEPLLPDDAEPVETLSEPLVPVLEADGAESTENDPEELEELSDAESETEPPMPPADSPDTITIRPPRFVSPEPTRTLTLPPAPFVLLDETIAMAPLLPASALDVDADTAPLTSPADERTVNAPLASPVPTPELTDTEPPVLVVLIPAVITIRPPSPTTPLLATTLTLPLVPLVARPVETVT